MTYLNRGTASGLIDPCHVKQLRLILLAVDDQHLLLHLLEATLGTSISAIKKIHFAYFCSNGFVSAYLEGCCCNAIAVSRHRRNCCDVLPALAYRTATPLVRRKIGFFILSTAILGGRSQLLIDSLLLFINPLLQKTFLPALTSASHIVLTWRGQ